MSFEEPPEGGTVGLTDRLIFNYIQLEQLEKPSRSGGWTTLGLTLNYFPPCFSFKTRTGGWKQ